MAEEEKKKPLFKLKSDRKSTTKERMDKVDTYFKLDPKVRSKIRKKKYDSLSDSQKNNLIGIKTAAEVASYFLPGGALRLAVPIVRGIQAAKTGFKVGKNTYKTLKEATAAKNKLKKVVPSKIKTRDPKTGKARATPDTDKTKRATQNLKTSEAKKLKAQQEALQARQNKTTKILKGSSNVGFGIGTAAAAEKFRNKKTIIKNRRDAVTDELGKVGEPKSQKKVNKRKPRTEQEKRLSKIASKNLTKKNTKPKLKFNKPDNFAKDVTKPTVKKGPARSVKEAQTRKLSTFTNKAGKKLAAVTKEQLDKSGLSLRDYLNKKEGLTRKKPTTKKMGGGKVYRRGGGRALRGMGKAIYSNKMY